LYYFVLSLRARYLGKEDIEYLKGNCIDISTPMQNDDLEKVLEIIDDAIVDNIVEDADTFFPEWGNEWKKVEDSPMKADEKHKYDYNFTKWKK
jgi:hypothetical protein